MTLPDWISDWRTGTANSAWYWNTSTTPQKLCVTQAMTMWKRVQRQLNTDSIQAPPRGSTTNAAITVDGDCGYQTLTALRQAALNIAASEPGAGYETLAATILQNRDAATGSAMSRATLYFAIWYGSGQDGDWNNYGVPSTALLPLVGIAPGNDGSAGNDATTLITCWQETTMVPVPRPSASGSGTGGGSSGGGGAGAVVGVKPTGLSAWWGGLSTGGKALAGVVALGGGYELMKAAKKKR